ncbi:hypothetical protein [Flavobacterium sp. UBA6031]|uniref:hypothetical protein n=1 Tax=Flavobacterium sp. UBA6031 TaxID=1946551 RepID=UPI0025BCB0D0|nr:hypothetical protein [Flavobacterium sp. UBA6031]
MKTFLNLAVTTAITVTILLSNVSAYSRNNTSYSSENRAAYTMAFYRTDTILVMIPDSFHMTETDKKNLESYVYFENQQNKPVYAFKHESEIKARDTRKHILLYGTLNSFQRKEFLRIPIKKTGKGFKFNNENFNQPNDAFYYVNETATRLYVCGNSNQFQHTILSIGIGAYPLHIFRGNEIVYTGIYLEQNQ